MMQTEPDSQAFLNDAFISYSRKDKEFAAKLENALKNYKPPKGLNLLERNLIVFRDEEDFTGGEYHASLEKHLKNSRKMIVICSPHARKSDFVNDEIRHFAQERGKENIIPVLASGIPNNEAKPEQEEEKAFPEALCEMMEMPLAASYIGFDPKKNKVNKGVFDGAWYKILADLYDISRNEIEERDKKRRRNKLIAAGIISSIIFLIITGLAIYAWNAKGVAEFQAELSRALNNVMNSVLSTQAKRNRAVIAFNPDGSRIALVGNDRSVKVWDAKAGKIILSLLGHENGITSVNFSPDGRLIATASQDNTARVWNGDTGAQVAIMSHEHVVSAIAFSPDGRSLLSASYDNTLAVWDALTGNKLRHFMGHSSIVTSVALSADGRIVASGSEDRTIRIWDLSTGKMLHLFAGHEEAITRLQFTEDARYLLSESIGGEFMVWDLNRRREITTEILRKTN